MIRSKIASCLKRVRTMGLAWGFLALALHVWPGIVSPAHAQGTRKDDIVFNSRGIPLAGATVRVCGMPASGQPCSPLALIYSDPGLTQAIANPTTTDGLGNYFFYAAPGKYEIEISGPGITTKQIPNVILPNDPSSPTFSGAISAFSLNLAGNLSVTGNTTVIGNLASGTLNLTNQGTPPGTAGSGTVNLYTKSTDKRLYYKDDTGTEVGPISSASGAQTNVSNTFTAPQNIDADFHAKGPNPTYDLSRYGGYASAVNAYSSGVPTPNTTGSITSGQTTLTLTSALDFANGHGIFISKAGPATVLTTPTAPAVTPGGILNGATTYNYQVVAEDFTGGLTAASAQGTTTTGAASLGLNNATVTNYSRTSGITTYTTSAPHNFQAGQSVYVAGLTGGLSDLNGVFVIIATPTSTTFTIDQTGKLDLVSTAGSGNAQMMAFNTLTWNAQATALRYWIYRNGTLVGLSIGVDPLYVDYGFGLSSGGHGSPFYVPTTPPGAAQAGYLATTIASGGGTTSLTLAAAAGSTVSGALVIHDNAPNFVAALTAATNGGTVYVPSPGVYQINSTLVLPMPSGGAGGRILVQSAIDVNNPIVPRGNYVIEGQPMIQGTSFAYEDYANLGGSAFPLIYMSSQYSSANFTLRHIQLVCNLSQQTCYFSDNRFGDGGGSTGQTFDHVAFAGSQNSSPGIFKGGFDYRFFVGVANSGNTFGQPPALRFTNSTRAVNGGGTQVPGRVTIDHFNLLGGGIQIDNLPDQTSGNSGNYFMNYVLHESSYDPLVRIIGGALPMEGFQFTFLEDADTVVCCGTPMVDVSGSSQVGSMILTFMSVSNGNEPMITGNPGGLILNFGSSPTVGSAGYVTPTVNSGYIQTMLNGGRLGSGLVSPSGVGSAVSSGGSVPVTTQPYQVSCVDWFGAESLPSSQSNLVTTTTGNQTVTTSWTAEAGCQGYYVYRNGARVHSLGLIFGTSFVDTFAFADGNSTSNSNLSLGSALSSTYVQAPALRLFSGAFSVSTSFPNGLTASRSLLLPDVTGYLPVSGYLNSSYDNFNRANGGIGINWTLQQNGLNVSSNQIVGTTSGVSNVAFWNAGPFAPTQFSQVTITGLNGTTDYPGVTVLASGSGGTSTYYDCVENSANIYLQRIVNTSLTTLNSTASTGAVGDLLRLEAAPGGVLTCYKNGVSILTATDTTITAGSPGAFISGSVATIDNWSGGNLHPLAHLDVEQDWPRLQHFTQGVAIAGESMSASPRGEQNVFLPGALTSTWTGSTWTLDRAITVTRLQVQAKTAPSGCTTNAVVRLTDGTTPVNLTISAAGNDSGAITQNYAAGAAVTVTVQTAAAGCTTSPADANVVVQYRMQ